jgi:hypothetical protein
MYAKFLSQSTVAVLPRLLSCRSGEITWKVSSLRFTTAPRGNYHTWGKELCESPPITRKYMTYCRGQTEQHTPQIVTGSVHDDLMTSDGTKMSLRLIRIMMRQHLTSFSSGHPHWYQATIPSTTHVSQVLVFIRRKWCKMNIKIWNFYVICTSLRHSILPSSNRLFSNKKASFCWFCPINCRQQACSLKTVSKLLDCGNDAKLQLELLFLLPF